MMRFLIVFTISLFSFASYGQNLNLANNLDQNQLFHIDLREIVKFGQNTTNVTLAQHIIDAFKGGCNESSVRAQARCQRASSQNPESTRLALIPQNVIFLNEGGHRKTKLTGPRNQKRIVFEGDYLTNIVYGVEIQSLTQVSNGIILTVTAHIHTDNLGHVTNLYQIHYKGDPLNQSAIKKIDQFRLSDIAIKLDVALIQLKLILSATVTRPGRPNYHFKKIYPIAAGALDNGYNENAPYRSLTPLFKKHYLHKNRLIFSRTEPVIYQGMPFLKIQMEENLRSAVMQNFYPLALRERDGIGFHRLMAQDGNLKRGLDSHGCMRLQIKDLYDFYYLLAEGRSERIEVNIFHHINTNLETPYPFYSMLTNQIKRVKYGQTAIRRGQRLLVRSGGAAIRVGRKVEVKTNRGWKEATVYRINESGGTINSIVYKEVDSDDLDRLEYVTAAVLRGNANESLDISDILMSELEATQWLYNSLENTELIPRDVLRMIGNN